MKPRKAEQIVVRVEPEVVERATKLQAAADRAGYVVTVSSIYRKAIDLGLAVLERRARRNRT